MPYPPPQGYPVQGHPMPMPGGMPPPPTGSGAVAIPAPSGVTSPAPAVAPPPPSIQAAPPAPSSVAAPAVAVFEEEAVAQPVDADGVHIFHPPALTHFEEAKPQNGFVKMWKKIGGGSLTLSLAIHAGIILLAGIIVLTAQAIQPQVDFLPGGGTQAGKDASADMQHKVQQKKRSVISKAMPMKKIVSTSVTADIALPEAPPDMLDVPDVSSMLGGGAMAGGGFGKGGSGGGFGNGMGIGGASGFVSLPPAMRSRCSTQERLEKLRQNGGSPECEAAVSRSLEWLKTQQNPDGSWGKANKAAMTGLALLCYLGRCETPDSPFYGDNVMKGILYLIELSKKNEYGAITDDFKGNAGAYEHGIATYALGEMYTLARLGSKSLPGMREAFEKGVELIIKCQNTEGKAEGSWDYYTKNISEGKPTSSREDLSVAGWQYQALKAAKHTGLKITGLHSAIDKTVKYIEGLQTKDGGIGKPSRDAHYNQWSLTGAGVLGLQTLGKSGKKSAINKGMKFLRDFITAEPLDWNKNCNLYCWYYYTQAFFQQGGDDWKFYNEQVLPQLLNNQAADGSWKTERPNWESGGTRGNAIYRQALCTLQLEVYYRYLKVADREDESFFER
ncbi:MAG: terpene cyclase/mutase family protein [Verrucomicrobiaceae bacterium]|nr:terpene cyclase/mutase family protein [Verrucomicrobiaceae bacterium]